MLLSHNQLITLIDAGIISGAKHTAVNSASIDLHLGNKILIEVNSDGVVDYSKRQRLHMHEVDITHGYILAPGEFILAQSVEVFNLPVDISGEYKLKSSMARIGLEHLNAGWADAGWHGSVLTLEFKNMTQFHRIQLKAGDAIGQMVFFKHEPVELDQSYAVRGRYNNDKQVSGIKP